MALIRALLYKLDSFKWSKLIQLGKSNTYRNYDFLVLPSSNFQSRFRVDPNWWSQIDFFLIEGVELTLAKVLNDVLTERFCGSSIIKTQADFGSSFSFCFNIQI